MPEEISGRGKKSPLVDRRAPENVTPRSMVPQIPSEETEMYKKEKGFKGPGREHTKNYRQQVMSVRTTQGFVRKSTWQVADVGRPLVSTSHIIQAGNDLFIGKYEAYITNRSKRVKSWGSGRRRTYTCSICL